MIDGMLAVTRPQTEAASFVSESKIVKTLLFLCTGNYYRSRYAEESFNHRAARGGLGWRAQSRGLAIERGSGNIGPLSPFALEALKERGLLAQSTRRSPQQCTTIDLEAASHIVALDESEHRPLMLERFPRWESRIEYWQVGDIEILRDTPAKSRAEFNRQPA